MRSQADTSASTGNDAYFLYSSTCNGSGAIRPASSAFIIASAAHRDGRTDGRLATERLASNYTSAKLQLCQR
jgi:hypothetical protein